MPRGSTGRRPVGKTGQMAPSDPVVDPISSRLDYDVGELRRAELAADPVAQLRRWLDDAGRAEVPEPNAMAVATVDAHGRPRVRNVLLRNLDEAGLVFYSNRLSAKGQAIDANPVASALFSWLGLQRQARVDADVEVIDGDLADTYWANRPRATKLLRRRRRRVKSLPTGPSSRRWSSATSATLKVWTSLGPSTGLATGWCPTPSSSGRGVVPGCTTGFVTG